MSYDLNREKVSYRTSGKPGKFAKMSAILAMTMLIAGCGTLTSGTEPQSPSEPCPAWLIDKAFYPSEEVISAMDRQEREHIAALNRKIETFCH